LYLFGNMAATVQGAYFFRNRVLSIPMYIGMSNDFYRPTKIASCAPGLTPKNKMKYVDSLY
jgi:hypothetical protein